MLDSINSKQVKIVNSHLPRLGGPLISPHSLSNLICPSKYLLNLQILQQLSVLCSSESKKKIVPGYDAYI